MISVSKDTQPGQYIYFPVGCQIANKYLAASNLFRHNDVPHEGIVIRIENGLSEAYKLKCFRFLGEESKSLDKGEIDIEADQ